MRVKNHSAESLSLFSSVNWCKKRHADHPNLSLLITTQYTHQLLETQHDWLGNYKQWREQGYPVGSGQMERAVAVVINMRLKKRGMRRKRANTTAIMDLRGPRISAEWE